MGKKILLLDSNYQVQSFIEIKRALKHIFKEKVEVLSNWDEFIYYGSGKMEYPAILKLKTPVRRNFVNTNFSRSSVVKRDKAHCQYCNKKLSYSQITIDHVLPKARGGQNSFTNCVVACQSCNNRKADRTPEEAGMRLMNKPVHPLFTHTTSNIVDLHENEMWHEDWSLYLVD